MVFNIFWMPLWAILLIFILIALTIFIVYCSISLICDKKGLNDIFHLKRENTNIDSLIGKVCIVTKDINNLLNEGQVFVEQNLWSALSEGDDLIIKEGEKVEVVSIKGVKLIVKKLI